MDARALASMPPALARSMKAARLLDSAASALLARADVARTGKRSAKQARLDAKADELLAATRNLTADLMDNAYDFVDSSIRLLDAEMKTQETELVYNGLITPRLAVGRGVKRKERESDKPSEAGGPASKRARFRQWTADMDLPVDPREPVYCLCQQVAFGEMIACDDRDCEVEWFHFQCVGLSRSNRPKKWFCPSCARRRRKAMRKSKSSESTPAAAAAADAAAEAEAAAAAAASPAATVVAATPPHSPDSAPDST
eukprot:PLAT2217.2.p1 GENE.PLAT2217.2~~PLAT2217.2.p1  ORF type:complete len:277 (+),score=55.38 PLAT2217.2:65-832(+)